MNATRRLLPLLLIPALAAPAAAELYQWTDDNGKVHFSDQQPANGKARAIPKPEPLRTGTGAAPKPLSPEAQADAKREQEAAADNAREKQRRCNSARESYQYWLDRKPFTINQQNGRKEYYREPWHDRRLQEARDYMQRQCKPD